MRSLVVASMLVVGCSDELPSIRYETAKAIIGTDFEAPLCRRDLGFIDAQIGFVEDTLDARADEPVEIYLYQAEPAPCTNPDVGGCFVDGFVASDWSAVGHEIVHAVTARVADPSAFWSEGTAVALDRYGTHRGASAPLANEPLAAGELEYATAGHFVRWLLESRDPAHLVDAVMGLPLEDIFDEPMNVLSERYQAEAPWAYAPWSPCDAPPIPLVGTNTWHETLEISCEHPDSSRFEGLGVSVVRSLALEAGHYELEISDSEGARILGCQTDALDEPPTDFAHGDVHSAAELSQTALGVLFAGGRTHDIDLTAGTYRLAISAGVEERVVTLTIRRVAG